MDELIQISANTQQGIDGATDNTALAEDLDASLEDR